MQVEGTERQLLQGLAGELRALGDGSVDVENDAFQILMPVEGRGEGASLARGMLLPAVQKLFCDLTNSQMRGTDLQNQVHDLLGNTDISNGGRMALMDADGALSQFLDGLARLEATLAGKFLPLPCRRPE